jgi:hypothetical protein
MPVPVLQAADPLTIPAKVYDKVWVEEVIISAPDPNGEVNGRVRLRRFTVVEGVAELEPEQGQWVEVKDVLAGSEADADLAAVMSSLLTYIAKIGVEEGVVAPPTA